MNISKKINSNLNLTVCLRNQSQEVFLVILINFCSKF